MHVLFVCNGNVCRSAIAERLTRAVAVEHRLFGLTAESAGTRALVGFPIEPLAAQAIVGLGGAAGDFAARRLRPEMIDRADLVLAMNRQLRDHCIESAWGAGPRTYTLLEAARIAKVTGARTIEELHRARNDLSMVGREGIADPVGLSAAAYCEVGDRIAEALVPLLLALAPVEQTHLSEGGPGLAIRPARGRAPLSTFLAAQRAVLH
ncbi:low molecular weight phosphatase family protein [Nocardia panacis]|uniref:Low molecular weight phosphatase family protein n=1 Tax=Nocardia panacis TaxID=2340916 RepID=A0A3A4JTC8_9NOCA|nr:low molecular weight phosphatase family protein [Nocardia panacis]RJO69219.1 low molecular weight phosphatase family protein [Nocardia panacis]